MKSMFLKFEDSDHEVIPKPKGAWVKDVVLKAINELRKERFEGPGEKTYVFLLKDGRVLESVGALPGAAWKALGYSYDDKEMIERFAPKAEAIREGWYHEG